LERGVSTHALSKQMGNSTTMLDKHYSKYSPLHNAELHSGRTTKKQPPKSTNIKANPAILAFNMLGAGTLTEAELLAALGVERDAYTVTEEIAMRALEAKNAGLIDGDTLLKILNG
jgi:hypothetical protein